MKPRLCRRLEADAKALCAFYQHGGLHGAVRLRWDSSTSVCRRHWVHHDEPTLYALMR